MSKIKHSKNVVAAHIDANGNVIVGDGNTIINLKEAAQCIALENEIQELIDELKEINSQIERNPEDDYFRLRLLKISEKRSLKKEELETLKQEVLRLAEVFSRISINTKRLEVAKQHFINGGFKEARAVLDSEKMGEELDSLLLQKENLQRKSSENGQQLGDKANEYLILAKLTAIDYDLPEWFEKTKEYFDQSLRAERNYINIFNYAYFLHDHNKLNEALVLYEEALLASRSLAKTSPHIHLPQVASILSRMAILQKKLIEFDESLKLHKQALKIRNRLAKNDSDKYISDVAISLNNLAVLYRAMQRNNEALRLFKKSLKIRKCLAISNPKKYNPYVAMTLNNLASLYANEKKFNKAQTLFEESLNIRRFLAESEKEKYSPYVARTLNTLADLHKSKNEFEKARLLHEEALAIRKKLKELNPFAHLPGFATTMNNLASVLCLCEKETTLALTLYEKALDIRRLLAKSNPQVYLPHLAKTAINLSEYFLKSEPNKSNSLKYCKEALEASLPFVEKLELARQVKESVHQHLVTMNEDVQGFYNKHNLSTPPAKISNN